MPKARKRQKRPEASPAHSTTAELAEKIEKKLEEYRELKEGCACFPFIRVVITPSVVDDVFDDLRTKHSDCEGRLNVIVDSGGGDIDAAYNLAMLFRKYGTKELNFIVPRWAKSAATLLVCSGDEILMSPVAELGPLDPQITQLNPLEKRLEQFSPLHVQSTLDMIRQEFEKGSEKLAKALMERLQFPLTLGGFIKSHEIGEQYLVKLLETRMLAGDGTATRPKAIAEKLTKGYADHGFCINIDEAISIGLQVRELQGAELDIVWEIHRLSGKKRQLEEKAREKEVIERIKDLPPELLEKLGEPSQESKGKRMSGTGREAE